MSSSKLSLAQLQQSFIAEFTRHSNSHFRDHIRGNKLNNNVEQLLSIYCNNHYSARLSALFNIFPITAQVIGNENFKAIALKYIKQYTSTHWDLNTNGKEFIDFIHSEITNIPDLDELFYLAELSRLEYFFHISYYADNPPKIAVFEDTPQPLAEQLSFTKNPSLYLFETPYPVHQIWENNRKNKGEQPVEDTEETYLHVICREKLTPLITKITAEEFAFLQDVIAEKTLIELVNTHGEKTAILIPLFIEKHWIVPRENT